MIQKANKATPSPSSPHVAMIVVAAGSGSRLNAATPKAYLPISGAPCLNYSLNTALSSGLVNQVIVAIHPDHQGYYDEAISKLGDDASRVQCVFGGAMRTDSVRAALEALEENPPELVLIHDAARPLLPLRVMADLVAHCSGDNAVMPVLKVNDTLRRQQKNGYEPVSRDGVIAVQTPQAFHYKNLCRAYETCKQAETDDMAIWQQAGGAMAQVNGDPRLHKITYPEDLALIEALVHSVKTNRVGQGYDVHRFHEKTSDTEVLKLGGVVVPHDKVLCGHSDADVVLHAVTDALLGTLADGDIGAHFSPSKAENKNRDSADFMSHACQLIQQQRGVIEHVDVTIICEAPKIGPHRDAIRQNIADLLGVSVRSVSVKATTTEGLGFTGRNEGMAAQAVASVSYLQEF